MTGARYELFPDGAGRWRFRLVAANGEVVGATSESYRDRTDARRAIADHAQASAQAAHQALRASGPCPWCPTPLTVQHGVEIADTAEGVTIVEVSPT